MTTVIPVQHVGHDLDMCCGTTCDAQLNKQYVANLEAELEATKKEAARLQALVNISNLRRK